MKYYLALLPLFTFSFMACNQKKAQDTSTTEVIYILSEQDECLNRIGQMNCYRYKTSPDSKTVHIYNGEIEGFTYLMGYNFLIKVEKVNKTVNDSLIKKWVLVETLKSELDENAYMVPEKITAEYYVNSQIKMDETTQYFPQIVPGNHTVFKLKKVSAQNERIADDETSESILIEVADKKGDFTLQGAEDVVSAYYARFCFCQYTGYASLKEFTFQATKEGNKYHVSITIPPQEMTIKKMGQTLENVDYVKNKLTFSETFDRKVSLKMMDEKDTPSAKYGKLNGMWELESIKGKAITEYERVMKPPVLEFQIGQRMYYGFDGCNTIRGAVAFNDDVIAFDRGLSTKKFCKTGLDEDFHKALNSVNHWEIKGEKLILLKDEAPLMVFHKK